MELSQAERQFKPCVNGDFFFLWGVQKFDSPQNQNPWPDWEKIGTVDHVGEGPVMQNFMQIPPRGFLGKWVKYK